MPSAAVSAARALAGRLPPRNGALLLLALASVFVFGGDRSQFYRQGHDDLSAQTLTLAANLSAEPEYAVARVVTGQYNASGHHWEAELAFGGASR